jgi:hypothetical protein
MVTTRTSKNVVLQQSGSLTVSFHPYIVAQKEIRLSAVVTDVRLSGFAQNVIDLLRINLKSKAQNWLDAELDPATLSLVLPAEIRDYTQLQEAHFYQQGNGELGMVATGTINLKSSDLLRLCHDFWPAGKCQAN